MKFRKLAALVLLLAAVVQLTACGGGGTTQVTLPDDAGQVTVPDDAGQVTLPDDSGQITPIRTEVPQNTFAQAAADFSTALLRQTHKTGENTTLSPYSVMSALAMTANGADGETRSEMEAVLGLPLDELNSALLALREQAGEELIAANSLWIRNDITVLPEFLQTTDAYYGAAVYQAPFDGGTVKEINDWIAAHTKDRIRDMLESLDPLTGVCLVNALTFDAKWASEFYEEFIWEEDFHAWDGTTQQVDMMHGTVRTYLSSGSATGFVKDYAGGRYSFVALLPNENLRVEDYVNQLDGTALLDLMENRSDEKVDITMPRFKTEYKESLVKPLVSMGMPLAFDAENADFSRMVDTALPVYIGDVLHQTYVSVDGSGTEAAAATIVSVSEGTTALPEPEPEPKVVILDRPFVWLIWDEQEAQPIFIGVVNSVTAA